MIRQQRRLVAQYEGHRKQFRKRRFRHNVSDSVQQKYDKWRVITWREFGKHLPARAARRSTILRNHGDSDNRTLPGTGSGKDSGSLRAVTETIGGVLDITAGRDPAALSENRRSDLIPGIRCIGLFPGG
jgi:hypothetical protein